MQFRTRRDHSKWGEDSLHRSAREFSAIPAEFELYDLQKDPGELNNLYDKPGCSALTQQLMNRISELRKDTGG